MFQRPQFRFIRIKCLPDCCFLSIPQLDFIILPAVIVKHQKSSRKNIKRRLQQRIFAVDHGESEMHWDDVCNYCTQPTKELKHQCLWLHCAIFHVSRLSITVSVVKVLARRILGVVYVTSTGLLLVTFSVT